MSLSLEFPRSMKMINAELLREKIIGPLPLGHLLSRSNETWTGLRYGNDAARGDRTIGGVHQAIFSKPV